MQSLLSVRDHGDGSNDRGGISVMGALSPLVVVAFIGTAFCTVGVFRDTTVFEVLTM